MQIRGKADYKDSNFIHAGIERHNEYLIDKISVTKCF